MEILRSGRNIMSGFEPWNQKFCLFYMI